MQTSISNMISRHSKYKSLVFITLLFFAIGLYAQIPAGYYNNANGKKKEELKTALYNIIKKHTVLEYYSSSTSFRSTDWHPATESAPNGYFWDMYSNYQRTSWSGMNREHSFPKSWWSSAPETTIAYSDLHNLYPSDAAANEQKLNYPIGEVTGVVSYSNEVIKVGKSNTYPSSYTGLVFEPANEYKGDFARDYMYVVTCYEDYANNWRSTGTSTMLLGGSTYPVFSPAAISLLLKWHRQDPVSEKEIVRNNAVYSLQKNRNPFIDHPELAEFIWGKYTNEVWTTTWVSPEEEVVFSCSPFPIVSSLMTVRLNHPEESTYFVKAVSGITVKTGKFSSEGALNVGELQNGIYLLEIYSAFKKRIVTKFIIRH